MGNSTNKEIDAVIYSLEEDYSKFGEGSEFAANKKRLEELKQKFHCTHETCAQNEPEKLM